MTKVEKAIMQRIAVWEDRKTDYRNRCANKELDVKDADELRAVCEVVISELALVNKMCKD